PPTCSYGHQSRPVSSSLPLLYLSFCVIRRPPRSTLFPSRRSSDLLPEDRVDLLHDRPRPRLRRRVGELDADDRIALVLGWQEPGDRKSTRLNSSHVESSYAVFCLKKKRSRCCGRAGASAALRGSAA